MTANTIANVEMTPQLETTEIRLKKLLVAIDFSEQTPHARSCDLDREIVRF